MTLTSPDRPAETVPPIDLAARVVQLEAALAASEARNARLTNVLSHATDAIVMRDLDGIITYWNNGAERLFGYSAAEAMGRPGSELHLREMSKTEYQALLERSRQGKPWHIEVARPTKSGERVQIAVSLAPVRDEAGAPIGDLAIARDITAERWIEAALRESEDRNRRLARIVEQFNDAIIAVDADDCVTYWNKGAERIFEYKSGEAIGASVRALHLRNLDETQYRAFRARFVRPNSQPFDSERITKSGRLIEVHGTRTPLLDDKGVCIGEVAIVRDVTERNRMQRALNAAEGRVRNLFDHALDALLVIDGAGRITDWNAEAERMFGWTRDEALGRESVEISVPERFRDRLRRMVVEISTTGKHPILNRRTEGVALHRSGREFPAEMTVIAVKDSNQTSYSIGIFIRDITERKNNERLLREANEELEQRVVARTAELELARDAANAANRAKSDFLANMSHEIRTPMNGVLGMTALLLKTTLNDRQRHFAQTVQNSGIVLLKVLNDILDFSKIEAGKLELEDIDFSLRNAVEGVVQLFGERAQAKGLELHCHISREVPDALRGDPGRMRQVLSNLLGNALKFTAEGEVKVSVGGRILPDGAIQLRLEVHDTGIGIDPAAQARIFRPFTQADSTTTRLYGGTGLGLSVSNRLVGLMQGEMGLSSTPGQGSTFWFTVRATRGLTTTRNARAVSLNGLRVLVADDNLTSREILHYQISGWGAYVRTTLSRQRTLAVLDEAARIAPFHLAVLSIGSQGLNGLELARAIRADERHNSIRLILLSAIDQDIPAAVLRELRIDRVLSKPVSESQLSRCLQEMYCASEAVDDGGTASPDPAPVQFAARLLLVEDNPVNQEVALATLEELGCTVDSAENGEVALAAVAKIDYDLVFMDCQMPVMDGFQATAAMRARETPGGPRLPIIALTAHAMSTDRERCRAVGMDDYLSKPFERTQLVAMLGRWLERRDNGSATDATSTNHDERNPHPNEVSVADNVTTHGIAAGDPATETRIVNPTLIERPPMNFASAVPSSVVPSPAPAASATTASGHAIDPARLDPVAIGKLRALTRPGKPNILVKLSKMFFSSMAKEAKTMADSLDSGDAPTLCRAAHTLKSSSAQFGANELSRHCRELEERAAAGDLSDAADRIANLNGEYAKVRIALERIVEQEEATSA